MLHGQWFQHSSRIFFQDFAHSQELVYLNECADLSVQSIFQKAQVRILDADDLEWPDRSDPASRVYFCRSIYDDTAHSLESLEERDREELRGEHDALECKNCHRKEYLDKFDSTQLLTRTEDSMVVTGFEHYLVQYHLNEFVFIKPEKRSDDPKKTDKTQLLLIAHILEINPKREKVLIQRYRRAVSRVFNERGLLKSKDKPMWIHFEQVESKCFVKFFEPDQLSGVEEWIEEDYTHFYVAACEDSPEKPLCEECLDNEEQNNQKTRTFFDKHKLRGMEVFAGAGGLSLGLEEGKGIEIKWAVELDASAAKTFAANHTASAVLCVDIKKLLRYVVDRRDHKSPDPLRTEAGQVIDDKLIPHPGQVDFLCGGPPCQSFSGANRFKRDNDERSMLPFVMLSLAEVYRPKYFLLENVTGLLYHKLSSPTTKQVIPMGTFKLIMRVLHALRFQVQAKVVQAGQYGVPQYRERVIFLAARNDAKLPSFPTPITTFVKGRKYKLSHQDQAFLRAPTRDPGPDVEEDSYAPHCRVTVRDVISDLPLWEWAGFQRQEQDADIVTFDASVKPLMAPPIGYHQPVGYAGPPQTPYQKALRASGSKRVRDHVTNYYSARLLTLCAHIPLSSKSNPLPCYEGQAPHSPLVCVTDSQADLPKSLNYKLKGGMSYGRLNEASYFSTAMTIVNPSSKGARLLHPNLNRVVTVLEAKRSQGFPDDFVLESVETVPRLRVKDFYRQIGNAVPVKLGAAFGRSIGAAFYIDHSDGEAAEGRATNERVPSPEY
ncbi:unnamed protein product [Mycena citricolor]|uniref:Cytosine-specific methyltransferase n=1 Tax=Mycena citricolor TaxID=2018698 RepID=A0AAD2K3S4_9AGAR|nr:unnamed protein product [Mycena citricolor]